MLLTFYTRRLDGSNRAPRQVAIHRFLLRSPRLPMAPCPRPLAAGMLCQVVAAVALRIGFLARVGHIDRAIQTVPADLRRSPPPTRSNASFLRAWVTSTDASTAPTCGVAETRPILPCCHGSRAVPLFTSWPLIGSEASQHTAALAKRRARLRMAAAVRENLLETGPGDVVGYGDIAFT